ncbi:hypothetical protein PS631_04588 [Pseudomonas fluorescens]|uniref:Uncharacterized protein n=1 Tax=Pseudomonas fluorescens TaxID=294 RepID=A0A5E6W8D1_PSEFL|nr:hypothetical protein PS631_04588 [Pseudomonas fluorescens]
MTQQSPAGSDVAMVIHEPHDGDEHTCSTYCDSGLPRSIPFNQQPQQTDNKADDYRNPPTARSGNSVGTPSVGNVDDAFRERVSTKKPS